jgi:hypothetical protein
MSFSKTITLPTGTLQVTLDTDANRAEHYLGFAARNNPKRGFLFVSKVLGKHYPCKPSTMLHSYQALVALLHAEITNSERLVFIGMAETATALGLGVHQEWKKTSDKSSVYCQTSRYFLSAQPYIEFEEVHSHQTDFYLYLPQHESLKSIFNQADTLILIDDEISTGNTFANLINAYKKINPHLQKVIVMSLLNVSSESSRQRIGQMTGLPIIWLSLLHGHYQFTLNTEFPFNPPRVNSVRNCKKSLLSLDYGRLGINHLINIPRAALEKLICNWKTTDKILVLGTGEFIYHAYLIGLILEKQGFNLWVQSTTRSPILVAETIVDSLMFEDNYDEHLDNFLYNRNLHDYDHILICHETPRNSSLNYLLSLLNAHSLYIHHEAVCIS